MNITNILFLFQNGGFFLDDPFRYPDNSFILLYKAALSTLCWVARPYIKANWSGRTGLPKSTCGRVGLNCRHGMTSHSSAGVCYLAQTHSLFLPCRFHWWDWQPVGLGVVRHMIYLQIAAHAAHIFTQAARLGRFMSLCIVGMQL